MQKLGLLFPFFTLVVLLSACSGTRPGAPAPTGKVKSAPQSFPGIAPGGAESSASAPSMPFVPPAPFVYRCEITVEREEFQSSGVPSRLRGSSVVLLDNEHLFARGDELQWAYFRLPSMVGEKATALAALPDDFSVASVSLSLSFQSSQLEGTIEATLQFNVPVSSMGGREERVSATALRSFEDKTLRAEASFQRNTKESTVRSAGLVVCERTKVNP